MKKSKSFIIADIVLSLLIIVVILAYRIVIEGKPAGFIIIGLIVFLLFNIILCGFSLVAIYRGQNRFVSKLWLSVISLVVFYFLTDLVGGFIFLHPADKRFHRIENDTSEHKFIDENYSKLIPDKIIHHRLPKDTIIRMYYPDDYDVRVNIGKTGFRSRIDSKEKNIPRIRILMLGDSFTLGEGVDDDETSSSLLEKYLNESSEKEYEVINLGVSSYSPILEYLQLKENIKIMKPDFVIVNFDMSDVVQEYIYRKAAQIGEDGEPLAVDGFPDYVKLRETMKARVTNWIYKHLFITTSIIELSHDRFDKKVEVLNLDLENAVMRRNRTLLLHTLKNSEFKEFNLCMSMVEDSILRVKVLCDQYGAKLILTTYPWGHQVSDEEWVPGRYGFLPKSFELSYSTIEELDRFSETNGIPFFNAFPYFRGYEGKENLYYNHDMHFTREGQKLMAEFLYKNLSTYFNQQ